MHWSKLPPTRRYTWQYIESGLNGQYDGRADLMRQRGWAVGAPVRVSLRGYDWWLPCVIEPAIRVGDARGSFRWPLTVPLLIGMQRIEACPDLSLAETVAQINDCTVGYIAEARDESTIAVMTYDAFEYDKAQRAALGGDS